MLSHVIRPANAGINVNADGSRTLLLAAAPGVQVEVLLTVEQARELADLLTLTPEQVDARARLQVAQDLMRPPMNGGAS